MRREDIDRICRDLPERSCAVHRRRLEQHLAGHAVHLHAWLSGAAVGHVGLVLPTDRSERHVAQFESAATINDLFVRADHRRRGIGRRLMVAAERAAADRGIRRLALDSGLDEGYAAARRLYRALGWREVPGTLHILTSRIPGDDGGGRAWLGILVTWRKDLVRA